MGLALLAYPRFPILIHLATKHTMDIAVIGIAGRFPEAEDVTAFYKNLSEGRDSVRPYSRARLRNTTVPTQAAYQIAGYLEDIDLFDNAFFNISTGEAEQMDPQHRLILEEVHHCLENSGYPIDYFGSTNTSVYVGHTVSHYYRHAEQFAPTLITGNLSAAMAGRISRVFRLRGKSMMIDTACSSSLVAVDAACQDLITEDADMALVCGVRLNVFPSPRHSDTNIGIEAPDGKAKAFAADANGTATGEAVVCVLLKPLVKAVRDKDIIHAIIKGTAVNQDADLSGSFTAPSNQAQAEVLKKAWAKAGIDPATIGYIEAHGTGTMLGDPIEIQGLDLAFRGSSNQKQFCAISSVKTNIGHTDSAAGLTGLMKVVLALKYRTFFPSLHFTAPNPYIDFANGPVFVTTERTGWAKASHPRRAGVSSFSLMGTNCHALLEESQAEESIPEPSYSGESLLYTLSAKSDESLRENVAALRAYLADNSAVQLKNVSYTLNQGRNHYNHRLAVVAQSAGELLASLAPDRWSHYTDKGLATSPDIVFVFSHDLPVSLDRVEVLCLQSPAFRTAYEQCRQNLAGADVTPLFLQFAFAYGFYHELSFRGVKARTLVGDGIGELVIAVLAGRKSLKDGIRESMAFRYEPHTNATGRRQALLDNFKGHPVVFVEMGPAATISLDLKAGYKADSNYRVVTLPTAIPECLIRFLRDLYLTGYAPDASAFFAAGQGKKIELPGYRFARTRCWLKEIPAEEALPLYQIHWIADVSDEVLTPPRNETLLVIADTGGLAEEIQYQLQTGGNRCIQVSFAENYVRIADNTYALNPEVENHYDRLAADIRDSGVVPDGILYLPSYDPAQAPSTEGCNRALIQGLYPLFHLCQAFSDYLSRKKFRFLAVTANANRVDDELVVSPYPKMTEAFMRGLLSDYPWLRAGSIDFEGGMERLEKVATQVLSELGRDPDVRFAAYRDGKRYIPGFKPLSMAGHVPERLLVREQGTYLITGGTGKIGLALCRFMARQKPCRLLVIGRSELPPKHTWPLLSTQSQTEAERKAAGLWSIESESGSIIEYYCADVSDPRALTTVFNSLRNSVTHLDGVLHLAGVSIDGIRSESKTVDQFAHTLLPKIQGSLLLEEACRDLAPDYFVFFSSLNAIVPQKNSREYAVANAFEDALAVHLGRHSTHFLAVNWPGWQLTDVASPETGLRPVKTAEGLVALAQLVARGDQSQVAMIDMDWELFINNPFYKFRSVDSEIDPEIISSMAPPSIGPAPVATLADGPDEPSLTFTEATVKQIWFDVLKAKNIQPDDDFFELGGHSLNGIQVLNRIEKEFQVMIDFDELFDFSTIRQLAARIDELLGGGKVMDYQNIIPLESRPYYELSHAQRRLWVSEQYDREKVLYNIHNVYRVEGDFNREAFSYAFRKLVERHESLRTSFRVLDGEPRQVIHPADETEFRVTYLDFRSRPNAYAEALAVGKRQGKAVFDLEQGVLMKTTLIHVEADTHVLIFSLHHIISDGWSTVVLVNELLMLYNAFMNGQEAQLPLLKIHYKDFAAWQNEQLSGDRLREHEHYWVNRMSGTIQPLELPSDYPRPRTKSYQGDNVRSMIGPDLSRRLEDLANQKGVSLYILLTAAIKSLLYRYTGQSDIVVGSVTGGREHLDLESQIGFYVNILPLRTQINGSDSFASVLDKVKETTLGAYSHQTYPFDELVRKLDVSRDISRTPLFDVRVELFNNEKIEREFKDVQITHLESNDQINHYDLTIRFVRQEEGISFVINYSLDLFRRDRIEKMACHFDAILKQVTQNADVIIADFQFDNEDVLETRELSTSFNFLDA